MLHDDSEPLNCEKLQSQTSIRQLHSQLSTAGNNLYWNFLYQENFGLIPVQSEKAETGDSCHVILTFIPTIN